MDTKIFLDRRSRLRQGAQQLILLFMRLVLAYGFYQPARMKWQHFPDIVSWFAGLGIPLPHLSAYLATGTETLGIASLLAGFGISYIAGPLVFTLLVAIATVHWGNGFDAGNNGFEIPLYYILMLGVLAFYGPGSLSLEAWLSRRKSRNRAQRKRSASPFRGLGLTEV